MDLFNEKSGLIVVGELPSDSCQNDIISLAEKAGYYIFADLSSHMRLLKHPHILNYFDLALLNSKFLELLNFDIIICLGQRVIS